MENFVELPEPLKMLLLGFVTVAVTEVLKAVGPRFKVDLSGYAAQVTSAVVASVLVLVNALLGHIPSEFAPIANAILNLVVVLLTSWGAYKAFKQFKK